MAFKLVVESFRSLKAEVSVRQLRIVDPQFAQSSVLITQQTPRVEISQRILAAVASYSYLNSIASYTNLQVTNLYLDPDTKNRYIRDEQFSFTDLAALNTGKSASDQFGFTDAAPIFDFTKAPSDSVEMLEDFDLLLTFNRAFTDGVSFSEVPAISFTRPVSDSFSGMTDAIQSINTGKGLSDAASLTEDIRKQLGIDFGDVESFGFEDVAALHPSIALPTDSIEFTDELSSVTSYFRTLTDAPTMSDSAPVFDVGTVLSTRFEFTDAESKDVGKSLEDSQSLEDDFSRVVSYNRSESDVYTFSHDVTRDNTLGKTDSVSLSEAPALDVGSVQEDSFGATDSPALHPNISATDTFSFGDILSRVVSFSRAFSDSFTLDDAATVDAFQKDYEANKTNVVGFSDVLSFEMQQQLADSFSLADVPSIAFSRSASDSVSFADSTVIDGSYQLSDSATMTDSLVPYLSDTSSSVLNADAFNLGTLNV